MERMTAVSTDGVQSFSPAESPCQLLQKQSRVEKFIALLSISLMQTSVRRAAAEEATTPSCSVQPWGGGGCMRPPPTGSH